MGGAANLQQGVQAMFARNAQLRAENQRRVMASPKEAAERLEKVRRRCNSSFFASVG